MSMIKPPQGLTLIPKNMTNTDPVYTDNSAQSQADPQDNSATWEQEKDRLSKRHKEQIDGAKAEIERLKAENEKLQASKSEPDQEDVKIIKQLGFVTKDDLQKYTTESEIEKALDKFYTEFPEYSPQHDENQEKYQALMSEFAQFRTTDKPKSSEFLSLFRKAQRIISSGDEVEKGKSLAKAEKNIADSLKHSNSGGSPAPSKSSSPEQSKYLEETKKYLKSRPWYKE
jgi:ElaB/YqjD/DUF883 family membrane-anchored ribosome-binding protein